MHRIGLVVHPRREISQAVGELEAWGAARGVDVVQVQTPGQERELAPPGEAGSCDLIVALGGDGTALSALRAGAGAGKPVLGVACGSLGALTAVGRDGLVHALDRFAEGDWRARRLPALTATTDGDETPLTAVNDLVIVRRGAGQVAADVHVDGELFIRTAGDGLIVATPTGSSAYTLAAGGPLLAATAPAFVVTPLAAHGGCAPPLVCGAESEVVVDLDPGHGGARIELDGQVHHRLERLDLRTLRIRMRADHAVLVSLGGEESQLAGLRRRRVLIDGPRVLARDEREALGSSDTGS